MGDALDVSGGSTWVSTEDLETAVEQLRRLSGEAGVLASRLAALESPVDRGLHARQAGIDIGLAARNLDAIAQRAGILHILLATAARGYEYQERIVASLTKSAGQGAGQFFGQLFPGLAVSGALLASAAGGLWYGIRSLGVTGPVAGLFKDNGIPKASQFWKDNNALLNSPAITSLVRASTGAIGPFLLGTTGVPQSAGPHSFPLGAGGVITAGKALGLLHETPVRLVETIPGSATAAPAGFADRLDRVPSSEEEHQPQVMIERYSVPGGPERYAVYVGGTVTFSPESGSEPWDMTSNIANAAGQLSGSVAAVEQAMAAAGIDASSPVQLTGYSQGGGVVACIAASSQFNIQGVLSFGGPTGQVPIPGDVPTVIVEHTEDGVPALGGAQDNRSAVLVTREAFGGGEIPHDRAFPSHNIKYYLETARLMDASDSGQLRDSLATLDGFTRGATLESSDSYRFERTD